MPKGTTKGTKTGKFVIPNSNLELKQDIINIAGNLGITYSQFLRGEIIKIRDSYSGKMKQPIKRD